MRHRWILAGLLLLALYPTRLTAAGEWIEGWNFRRSLEVNWEAEKASGDELATAQFYTAGHCKPDGSDIRVATPDGRIIPSHVLLMGCGADIGNGPVDQATIVFSLQKGVRNYNVYFGNDAPPTPPKGTDDVNYKWGVLLETRSFDGQKADTPEQLEDAFNHSKKTIGKAMIDRIFLGVSPFDDRPNTIMRFSAQVFAPGDGPYEFAGAVQNRGALFVDGKPILWIPGLVGDIRFHANVDLKRGPHQLVLYGVNFDGEPRVSLGWKRPDSDKVEIVGRESFGILGRASAGPLEERGHALTADFVEQYEGECFYENHYSHRVKFEAPLPPNVARQVNVVWDFGDGQAAISPPGSAMSAEHVYLSDGTYAVKAKFANASGSDTQTTRILVRRFRAALVHPPTDEPPAQSAIVAKYALDRMSGSDLAWATLLHERAHVPDAMLATAAELAGHEDVDGHLLMQALTTASDAAQKAGQSAQMAKVWDAVPASAKWKSRAVEHEAPLLLYRLADFKKAVSAMEPFVQHDLHDGAGRSMLRLYGQALILDGRADEGKKILAALPVDQPERQAAMSGAMARTVEYFITEKDADAGEEAWVAWQNRFPAEFAQGYSVLLQTKLMELSHSNEAAAKVAEAFALAIPDSSYAPQLLDRASKLRSKSDPEKSKSLRTMLKQKYPEDPLSQDK